MPWGPVQTGATESRTRRPSSILIAGGTSGIGRETAALLLDRGAAVAIVGRDPGRLDRACATLGGSPQVAMRLRGYRADLSKPGEMSEVLLRGETDLGAIDGVVCAIGGGLGGPTVDLPWEVWRDALSKNLTTPWLVASAVHEHYSSRTGGSLVLLGSVAGTAAMSGRAPTVAANHAVTGLAGLLRASWRASGTDVALVQPGLVATERIGEIAGGAPGGDPVPVGNPGAVAAVVVKALDESRSIGTWIVDGGWSAGGLQVPSLGLPEADLQGGRGT